MVDILKAIGKALIESDTEIDRKDIISCEIDPDEKTISIYLRGNKTETPNIVLKIDRIL